jgi:hypothetical protein
MYTVDDSQFRPDLLDLFEATLKEYRDLLLRCVNTRDPVSSVEALERRAAVLNRLQMVTLERAHGQERKETKGQSDEIL